MPSIEDFKSIIEAHPELCADGFGVGGLRPKEDFDELRAELFDRFDGFAIACDWLAAQKWRKTVNRDRTSLEVKHDVEHATKQYCRYGAFIAAVIYLGIPYARCKDQPHCVHLAVSDQRPR